MTSKTQLATEALLAVDEVKNRGHAFVILKEANLTGSGAVFNAAVKAYQVKRGVELGKSATAQRNSDNKSNRATAHQMSAVEVLKHIKDISNADQLFWACWKVYQYEGKWQNKLKTSDFAIHFR